MKPVLLTLGYLATMLTTARLAYVLQHRSPGWHRGQRDDDLRVWALLAGLLWPLAWIGTFVWLVVWVLCMKLLGSRLLFRPVRRRETSDDQ